MEYPEITLGSVKIITNGGGVRSPQGKQQVEQGNVHRSSRGPIISVHDTKKEYPLIHPTVRNSTNRADFENASPRIRARDLNCCIYEEIREMYGNGTTHCQQMIKVNHKYYLAFYDNEKKPKAIFGVGDLFLPKTQDLKYIDNIPSALKTEIDKQLPTGLLWSLIEIFGLVSKPKLKVSAKIISFDVTRKAPGINYHLMLHLDEKNILEVERNNYLSMLDIQIALIGSALENSLKFYEFMAKLEFELIILVLSGGMASSVTTVASMGAKKALRMNAAYLAKKVANRTIKRIIINMGKQSSSALIKATLAASKEVLKGSYLLETAYQKKMLIKRGKEKPVSLTQAEIEGLYAEIFIKATLAFFKTYMMVLIGKGVGDFVDKKIYGSEVSKSWKLGFEDKLILSIKTNLMKILGDTFSKDLIKVASDSTSIAATKATDGGVWNEKVFKEKFSSEFLKNVKSMLFGKITTLLKNPSEMQIGEIVKGVLSG